VSGFTPASPRPRSLVLAVALRQKTEWLVDGRDPLIKRAAAAPYEFDGVTQSPIPRVQTRKTDGNAGSVPTGGAGGGLAGGDGVAVSVPAGSAGGGGGTASAGGGGDVSFIPPVKGTMGTPGSGGSAGAHALTGVVAAEAGFSAAAARGLRPWEPA
jgi:hypothetical protein